MKKKVMMKKNLKVLMICTERINKISLIIIKITSNLIIVLYKDQNRMSGF